MLNDRAKKISKIQKLNLEIGNFPQEIPNPEGNLKPFILDLINQYIGHMKFTGRKASTIETFNILRISLEKVEFRIPKLDNTFVQRYSDEMVSRGACNSTIDVHIQRFKTVFNFFKAHHTIDTRKFRQLSSRPLHELKDEILSNDEVQSIWDFKPTKRWHSISRDRFLISIYTGCRASELPTIFLSKPDEIGYYSSKDNEARFIPMYPKLAEVIERGHFRQTHCLSQMTKAFLRLLNLKGEGMKILRQGNDVKRTMIPRWRIVTFHSCRKTFAVRMLEGGADIYTVSKLMGHSSVAITLRYYAFITQEKMNERVHEVFNKWK